MSTKTKRRLKLVLISIFFLALVGSLVFTSLGRWLALGAGGLWQGFLNLPGMTWARQQMEASSGFEQETESSADMEAVNAILRAGHALQEQEAYEGALQRYREALNLKDDYAPTHMALASLYLQSGREDDALEQLEKAAQLDPDEGLIQGQLGHLYLKRRELEKAVDALERARELEPEESLYRYWLGVAYHYRSYADVEKAIFELETAVELEPDQGELYYHLAMATMRRDDEGDEQQAIRALEKAVELDPSQTEALYYLGQLYFQLGEPEAAASAWRQYVATSDDAESVEAVRDWLRNLEEVSESGTTP